MKVKFYEAMVVVILSLMLASCQGGDVELKSIHIEALKQIRFYHYRVANVKAELVREIILLMTNWLAFMMVMWISV